MRTAVVLPAPLGPSTPSTVPSRAGQVDPVQRLGGAEALGEPLGLDGERHQCSPRVVVFVMIARRPGKYPRV